MKGADSTTNLNQHLTTIQVTNMKYITILDFEVAKVYQYKVDSNLETEDLENIIVDFGFNLNNIEWMYHSHGTVEVFFNK